MSTYSHAGVSKLDGKFKVRFANDLMRIKVLAKSGHEDIRLADLEKSVSKLEAAKMLLTLEDFSDAVAQATITEYIAENTPKQPKAKAAPAKAPAKSKAPKAKAPAKAAKTPVTPEDEDAPF